MGTLRQHQSEGRYTQKIGRGTRIPDGIGNLLDARKNGVFIAKEDCVVLDFVDSTSKHSLVTLPTLFGLNCNTDLRGRAISKVAAEIAQSKLKNPYLDITKLTDVNQLQSYAEHVDLFKTSFPGEITAISEYQWHKTADKIYAIALPTREGLAVACDILGRWHIIGEINGCRVRDTRPTFEEAVREADLKISVLGRAMTSLINRVAKWNDAAPTTAQLSICKRQGIVVAPGATKEEVSSQISKAFQEYKKDRDARMAALIARLSA